MFKFFFRSVLQSSPGMHTEYDYQISLREERERLQQQNLKRYVLFHWVKDGLLIKDQLYHFFNLSSFWFIFYRHHDTLQCLFFLISVLNNKIQFKRISDNISVESQSVLCLCHSIWVKALVTGNSWSLHQELFFMLRMYTYLCQLFLVYFMIIAVGNGFIL